MDGNGELTAGKCPVMHNAPKHATLGAAPAQGIQDIL